MIIKEIKNEEIVSYLNKELKAYEKTLYLIQEQEKAIKSANTQKLNLLTKEKEGLISSIKNMKRCNMELQEQIMSKTENVMSDNRIVELIKKIHAIVTMAFENNQFNLKLISSAIDTEKMKSDNLSKKRKMASTLKMLQSQIPRFVDVIQ